MHYPGLLLGGGVVGLIYLPAIFSIIWLFQYHGKIVRKVAIISFCAVFVLTPMYYAISYESNVVNYDSNRYQNILPIALWSSQITDENINITSDELTMGYIQLYRSKFSTDNISTIQNQISIISSNEVESIEGLSKNVSKDMIILNTNLNSMSIEQWRILKSWTLTMKVIQINPSYSIIYSSQGISILSGIY